MSTQNSKYRHHRFRLEIISYAKWLNYRFSLSYRAIEDLLAERGVIVSYESSRYWCLKFGLRYQHSPKKREDRLGDDWFGEKLCSATGLRIEQVMGYCKWFILAMFISLMIVSFIPATALWFM